MRNILPIYLVLILMISGLISCASPRLYREPKNLAIGKLTQAELVDLKSFLQPFTNGTQQDTLIIKYEINGESCWDALDRQSDDYINRVIINGRNYKKRVSSERPGASFYHFKEKGNKTNKIIWWDNAILTDEQNKLAKLLFKEKATCGSSGVVLPGGEYLIVRSDSHLVGFGLTKEMIAEALQTKRIKSIIDRSGR